MSHIVKGSASVNYTDKNLLVSALTGLGTLMQNAALYRVGAGYTREKYGLVLVDSQQETHRIGYQEENGIWQQYQEDYGTYGAWTRKMATLIQDRYLGFHYQQQLQKQGFNASVVQMPNGVIEVQAEEMTW